MRRLRFQRRCLASAKAESRGISFGSCPPEPFSSRPRCLVLALPGRGRAMTDTTPIDAGPPKHHPCDRAPRPVEPRTLPRLAYTPTCVTGAPSGPKNCALHFRNQPFAARPVRAPRDSRMRRSERDPRSDPTMGSNPPMERVMRCRPAAVPSASSGCERLHTSWRVGGWDPDGRHVTGAESRPCAS